MYAFDEDRKFHNGDNFAFCFNEMKNSQKPESLANIAFMIFYQIGV